MNTNYSKIALLLALGVIAGNEVSANIKADNIRLRGLSSDSALNDIKIAGESYAKINNRNKSRKDLDKTINVYNEAVTKKLVKDNSSTNANLQAVVKSDKAAKTAIGHLKTFKEGLEQDIKNLFTATPLVSMKVINLSDFSKDSLQKLVSAAQADGKLEDLFARSNEYQNILTELAKVTHKTEKAVKLSELITKYGLEMSKSGFNNTLTSVKSQQNGQQNGELVDIIDVQNKIKFGLPAFAAKVASGLNDLQEIGEAEVKEIVTGAKQYDAYKGIVRTLKLMPSGESEIINHINKNLGEWFKKFKKEESGTPANTLNARLLADKDDASIPGTAVEKTKAFMDFLNAVFGQNTNAKGSPSKVFYFTDSDGGKSNADSVVSNSEAFMAGFGRLVAAKNTDLDTDNSTKADAVAGAADTRGTIYDNLMKPILAFIKSGLEASDKVTGRNYKINDELKTLMDVKDLGNRPKFTKALNDPSLEMYMAKAYLDDMKNYVTSNKSKVSFVQEEPLVQSDVASFVSGFEQLSAELTKYLTNADAKVTNVGVFQGKTAAEIQKFVSDLKDVQSQISKEMGDAPAAPTPVGTAAAPAAPAAVTPDVKKETEAEKEKRLDDFLAQGKEKGVRKIEEKERVNLDDIDLTALFNSQTGKLLNGDDAKEALESLNKFLAEIMTSLKGDSKKPVPLKTKKEKADSIINELVEKFTEAYDGEDPEDEDDAKKKKALTVAKNKAVAAAKDAITTKVYKAFGINVQKTSGIKGQGLKKGIGVKNNTRGRNRARGSSRIKVNRGRKGQKNETVEKNDTVQKDRRGKRGAMGRRGRTKASNKSEE